MTFRRMTAALLLAFVALGPTTLPASAHTELKSSNPAKGAALPAPPQQVELTFTEAVTVPADAITVTGPDSAKWTVGPATVAGAVVTAPVQATGPAGTYTVTWKVVSSDGDPVTGTIGFTLTNPATTTTTAPTTTTTTTAAPSGVRADRSDPRRRAAGCRDGSGSSSVRWSSSVSVSLPRCAVRAEPSSNRQQHPAEPAALVVRVDHQLRHLQRGRARPVVLCRFDGAVHPLIVTLPRHDAVCSGNGEMGREPVAESGGPLSTFVPPRSGEATAVQVGQRLLTACGSRPRRGADGRGAGPTAGLAPHRCDSAEAGSPDHERSPDVDSAPSAG